MAQLNLDRLIQDVQKAKNMKSSIKPEDIHQAMQAADPVSAIANLFQNLPSAAWSFLHGERIGDIDLPKDKH